MNEIRRTGCMWMPDFMDLALLKPAPGRVLSLGAAQTLNLSDAAAINIGAGLTVNVAIRPNAMLAGSWLAVGPNQAVLFEFVRGALISGDASGKLQVVAAQGTIDNSQNVAATSLNILPLTFPPLAQVPYQMCLLEPIPLLLPRPGLSTANGPGFSLWVTNTDGAAAHSYMRALTVAWRVVDNIDPSAGAALPGGGISPEFH